jgi:hypothetical protein
MNPSKDKGTRAETAVTRYARGFFPNAQRLPLHGSRDIGDVQLCPGVIIEVKAGKAAQTASLKRIRDWIAEMQTEVENAHAELGLLVTQRQGLGLSRVEDWECWTVEEVGMVTMRSLRDTLELLLQEGYQ